MTTKLDVVKGVKELLCDKARWTQGAFARDKDGKMCDMMGLNAVCWCVSGAYSKIRVEKKIDKNMDLWDNIYFDTTKLFNGGPVYVNDTLGYEKVMELLSTLERKYTDDANKRID